MANPAEIAIWILALLLFLGIIVWLILVFFVNRPAPTPVSKQETCTKDKTLLHDLTGVQCCLDSNQNTTNNRYLTELDLVVATYPTNPIDVCSSLCASYSSGQCHGSDDQQRSFQGCLDRIQPVNCQGVAYPVAYIDDQFFYAKSTGKSTCMAMATCPTNTSSPINTTSSKSSLLVKTAAPGLSLMDQIDEILGKESLIPDRNITKVGLNLSSTIISSPTQYRSKIEAYWD